MTSSFILFLALGAAFGGFVNGLAGTGTALFSLGFYLMVSVARILDLSQVLVLVSRGVEGVLVFSAL